MNNEIKVEGKTLEEAIQAAMEQFGASSIDEIKYTVLEEGKKGFLGIGAATYKISATYEKSGETKALEFIKSLVSNMGINAEITVDKKENDETVINVAGDETGILIGHHGETLDSIQYLMNLAVNKRENGEKRKEKHAKVHNALRA